MMGAPTWKKAYYESGVSGLQSQGSLFKARGGEWPDFNTFVRQPEGKQLG